MKRGRPKQFEGELRILFTTEQLSYLEDESKRWSRSLSETVRHCVQAQMLAGQR